VNENGTMEVTVRNWTTKKVQKKFMMVWWY